VYCKPVYYYPPSLLPCSDPVSSLKESFVFVFPGSTCPTTPAPAAGALLHDLRSLWVAPRPFAAYLSSTHPNNVAYARVALLRPNVGPDAWSYYYPRPAAYAHGSASWGPDGRSGLWKAFDHTDRTGRSAREQNMESVRRCGLVADPGPNHDYHPQ